MPNFTSAVLKEAALTTVLIIRWALKYMLCTALQSRLTVVSWSTLGEHLYIVPYCR